jgi:hypothetical protein
LSFIDILPRARPGGGLLGICFWGGELGGAVEEIGEGRKGVVIDLEEFISDEESGWSISAFTSAP